MQIGATLLETGLAGSSRKGHGYSSSHVWMWELDYKENWVPNNWCFWIVALEKTVESPLDCKEIQPVNCNRNQSWIFIRRTDAEAETPILLATWNEELTHWKRLWCWERLKAGGEGDNRGWDNEMVGWHHWLDGPKFEQPPGVGDGQGSLACCSPWVCKELDTTEWLNWTECYPQSNLSSKLSQNVSIKSSEFQS